MLKKITCILLSVFILSAFILQSNIYIVLASDNDFTLSVSYDKARNGFALSSSESSNAVNNKGDIYTSDHLLMFMYTPADSYNWTTYAKNTVLTLHLSDSQLKAILMSSNPFENLFYMIKSLSNTETIRAIAKGLGIAFNGKSSVGTELLDTITGNYNYLNGINYDIESQTLTIDNSSVDKLREEIQRYYYQSIGLVRVPVTNKNPATAIDMHKSYYEYEEDYMSDYNAVAQYDYSAYCTRGNIRDVIAFDLSRYNYSYIDSANPTKNGIIFLDNQLNVVKSPFYHFSDFNDFDTDGYKWYISNFFISYEQWNMAGTAYFIDKKIDSNGNFKENYSWCDTIGGSTVVILSQKYKYFTTFSSYSALYNFLHGDQNAYLSSTIDKTGEDITFSIKDMNENLGSKMDKLLDRNLKEYDIYCADVGQRKYIEANARKGANNKVACDSEYLLFIRDKVKQHYSFYSANELAKQEGFNTRVCLTTLYNYFNKHFIKLKKSDMPYNKIKKVKQEKETKRVYQYGKRSIDEREDLQQRDIYGHWEMDTVQGQKKKKGCILVLSERKTRQELLFKLDNKQCASVWNTLQDNWDKLKHHIKTITCDNGVEFSTNCELSNNELIEFVRTNLYYCHPYRSGERGTNENQNKLIRRFYPKGVDLSNVTQEDLNKIQDFMNNMPRKIFNGLSSNQFLKLNEMEYLQT